MTTPPRSHAIENERKRWVTHSALRRHLARKHPDEPIVDLMTWNIITHQRAHLHGPTNHTHPEYEGGIL